MTYRSGIIEQCLFAKRKKPERVRHPPKIREEAATRIFCVLLMFSKTEFSLPVLLVGYDVVGFFFSGILILCLTDERVEKLFRVKWLMTLGTISYCVYLTHAKSYSAFCGFGGAGHSLDQLNRQDFTSTIRKRPEGTGILF